MSLFFIIFGTVDKFCEWKLVGFKIASTSTCAYLLLIIVSLLGLVDINTHVSNIFDCGDETSGDFVTLVFLYPYTFHWHINLLIVL